MRTVLALSFSTVPSLSKRLVPEVLLIERVAIDVAMEKVRPAEDVYRDEGQRRRYGTACELWRQGVDVVELVRDAAHNYGMDFFLEAATCW